MFLDNCQKKVVFPFAAKWEQHTPDVGFLTGQINLDPWKQPSYNDLGTGRQYRS